MSVVRAATQFVDGRRVPPLPSEKDEEGGLRRGGPREENRGALNLMLDMKPRPNPEAALERVGGRWMVATPDDQLHYFVEEGGDEPSAVGDRIIDLADGSRTVREIAAAICSEFEVDETTALTDTREFVGQLLERRVLVSQGGELPAGGAPSTSPEPGR
jgi:pyrroloquinoline quinone biosynthesis protein D